MIKLRALAKSNGPAAKKERAAELFSRKHIGEDEVRSELNGVHFNFSFLLLYF